MKEIRFIENIENLKLYSEEPKPSKLSIPEWYKDHSNFNLNNPTFNDSGNITNRTFKNCMPFLDAFSTGYIERTSCDIWIDNTNNEVTYTYTVKPEPIAIRSKPSLNLEGFYPLEFVWKQYWTFELPQGYSALITHPLNHYDLPFITLSGVVDADYAFRSNPDGGNLPFYLKDGFTGLIPCGTPMYQIIPFKRDSWKSSIENYDEKKYLKDSLPLRRKFINGYKNLYWKRKTYL